MHDQSHAQRARISAYLFLTADLIQALQKSLIVGVTLAVLVGAFLHSHALPLPCRVCNGSVKLELAADVMYIRLDADTGRLGLLS